MEDQFLRFEELGALFRSTNHFHNPLFDAGAWSNAGLDNVAPCLGVRLRGQSSIQWAQNPTQGADFASLFVQGSWQQAREAFYDGLTAETAADREKVLVRVFTAIGQQMHLVADMAVPAHTRNDAHCGDGFEKWARRNANFVGDLLNAATGPLGDFRLAVPDGEPARIPIARLWDSDLYSGANPDVTNIDPRIGLSEYTNANFFSDGTTSGEFPYPELTSADLRPIPDPAPTTGEPRLYFSKTRDGETIDQVAVPSALAMALPEPLASQRKGLDAKVFENYATRLIPRAASYATSLLNYFVRGRLDVSIQEANVPGDPRLLELRGTNGSAETLTDGRVGIFVERDGERRRAHDADSVPLQDVEIADAAPGAPILAKVPGGAPKPIQFRSPFGNVEVRYVIVYTGGLGDERPRRPDFVGAVIGKVTPGAHAESIYRDGTRTILRTAEGVFPIAPEADGLDALQWGDVDNTFVGLVVSEENIPQAVKTFRIARAAGSAELPLTPETGDDRVVSVEALKNLDFPFDLPLGVSVSFQQQTHFVQQLWVWDRVDRLEFRGDRYPNNKPEDPPIYQLTAHKISPVRADVVVDRMVDFGEAFPLVLDLAHFQDGWSSVKRPYMWRIEELALDAQGRALALVEVELTYPVTDYQEVPIFEKNRQGVLVSAGSGGVRADFPGGVVLYALIDVERRQVLGTTSAPEIVLTSQTELKLGYPQQRHVTRTFAGGDLEGTGEDYWERAPFFWFPEPTDDTTWEPEVTGELDISGPDKPINTFTGILRDDLKGLTPWQPFHDEFPVSPDQVGNYEMDGYKAGYSVMDGFVMQVTAQIPFIVKQVQQTGTMTVDAVYQTFPRGVKIVRPGSETFGPEVIMLYGGPIPREEGEHGLLVRWNPETPGRSRLAIQQALSTPWSWHLEVATSDAAMIRELDFFDDNTRVVTFETEHTQTFYGQDLAWEYVLLAPDFLYSVVDTRFHLLEDALPPTAVPLALAPSEPRPAPFAAYHLIRLP